MSDGLRLETTLGNILKYVIVNENNVEDEHEFDTLVEARGVAEVRSGLGERLAIIERQYAFEDSDLAWTSTGDTTWPPMTTEEEGE